jgi:hypothetical protein
MEGFEVDVVAKGFKVDNTMGGDRSNSITSTILALVARGKMGLNSKFFIIIKGSMAELGNRKHKKMNEQAFKKEKRKAPQSLGFGTPNLFGSNLTIIMFNEH